MQGRLSPPRGARIQSFPLETWREEFSLARHAGLNRIEWIYELETEETNPLRTNEGISEIQQYVKDSGVGVWSICADYYLKEHLVSNHLQWLISRAARLRAQYIVLPFVDESSLKSREEVEGLRRVLHEVLKSAEKYSIALHLETDLEAEELAKIMEEFSHPLLKVNYDIGNSAALGRRPEEELDWLARWLGSVHVKDRLLGGGTVGLGSGTADFATCFRLLHTEGYQGPFILQVAREAGLSEVDLAIRNRLFVEEQLVRHSEGEARRI